MGALDDLIQRAGGAAGAPAGAGGGGGRLQQLIAQAQQSEQEPDEPDADADERGRSVPFVEPDPNIPPQPMPQEQPWYANLLAPFSGALPGGAITHASQNPGLNAGVQGLAHGLTAGVDQNIPGYGDFARQERQGAAAESPRAYRAGDVAGAVLSPLNFGRGYQGAVGNAAVQGAARSFSDANPDIPFSDRAEAAAHAGADSAGAAAVIGAGAQLAGSGASVAARGAGWLADKARAAIFGNAAAFNRIAENQGLERMQQIGQLPEQLGVTNRIVPQDAATYADRLIGSGRQITGRAGEAGAQVRDAITEAETNQLAPGFVDKPALIAQLQARQTAAANSGAGDAAAEAGAYGAVAQGMGNRTINTPSDLWRTKSFYDQRAYPDAVGGSPESFMGQAHQAAGNAARGQLRSIMSHALPETEQAYVQGSKDYGAAVTLGQLARQKAAQQDASFSKGNFISRYAPDAVANVATLGRDALSGVSGTIRGMADQVGALVGARGNGVPSGGNASSSMQSWLANKGVHVDNITEQSRGNQLGTAAIELLHTDPSALGQYQQQFAEAAQNGPEAVNALIVKLEEDQAFRTGPMQLLQQRTGGN
jgi:hypothetical protein